MARGNIFDQIDPSRSWTVVPSGGYETTDETPSAATVSASSKLGIFSPQHEHFGFGALLLGTTTLIFFTFEGKPSGVKGSADLGPLDVEGGVGIDNKSKDKGKK